MSTVLQPRLDFGHPPWFDEEVDTALGTHIGWFTGSMWNKPVNGSIGCTIDSLISIGQ